MSNNRKERSRKRQIRQIVKVWEDVASTATPNSLTRPCIRRAFSQGRERALKMRRLFAMEG